MSRAGPAPRRWRAARPGRVRPWAPASWAEPTARLAAPRASAVQTGHGLLPRAPRMRRLRAPAGPGPALAAVPRLRAAAAGPLRPGTARSAHLAGRPRTAAAGHVALPGAAADAGARAGGLARRGRHRAAPGPQAGGPHRRARAPGQGRGDAADRELQGARRGGWRQSRRRAGRPHAGTADGRQRRRRLGRLRLARRPGGRGGHAGDHPERHPPRGGRLRGGRLPGPRIDLRRRRGGAGGLPAVRLVRRLHPRGALPGRGQEDHGLRAGRPARLAPAGRDRLPHRRWRGPDRHVEGLPGAAWARLAAGGLAAPPVRGRAGRRLRTGGAGVRVPKPLGDFLILRALRETSGTALAVTDGTVAATMELAGATEGMVVCPEGAVALAAAARLRRDGWIEDGQTVAVFNTGTGLLYEDSLPGRPPRRLGAGEVLPAGRG